LTVKVMANPFPADITKHENVNVLTNQSPPYDPAMSTYQLRGLLCRIDAEYVGVTRAIVLHITYDVTHALGAILNAIEPFGTDDGHAHLEPSGPELYFGKSSGQIQRQMWLKGAWILGFRHCMLRPARARYSEANA